MSVSNIPDKVRYQLWAISGGRCELHACNKLLSEHAFTLKNYNGSVMAHIVADSPDGPRGDQARSKQLADKIENLMLVCPTCHTMIDSAENLDIYTEEVLLKMKREHEERIKHVTGITADCFCHTLTYFAQVGEVPNLFTENRIKMAMIPKFAVKDSIIRLYQQGSMTRDNEALYWATEKTHLERSYSRMVSTIDEKGEINRIAVFALAPMPLLIRLGALLGDKKNVDVYQKRRVPDTWKWDTASIGDFDYFLREPSKEAVGPVALNISLSATITDDRIVRVLGEETNIWTLTIEKPSNDFVTSVEHVERFNVAIRSAFDVIKAKHGHESDLHIFPSCPASLCVEFGRVWMPKADMGLKLYDENRELGGFVHAFDIKGDYSL